jgi:hypothetical protein
VAVAEDEEDHLRSGFSLMHSCFGHGQKPYLLEACCSGYADGCARFWLASCKKFKFDRPTLFVETWWV